MVQKTLSLSTASVLALAANTALAHDHAQDLSAITAFFAEADVVAGPDVVPCKLSGGTETECFSITVRPSPLTYTPGPWCPTHITDGPEAGGVWFVDGELVDVDGDFITRLAEIYGDANWQLFDPDTGDVRYTGTLEACEAAARPDVDPEYQNHCVQCLPEYMPEDSQVTYVIPLEPVMAAEPVSNRGGSGIASNGVRLDGPAPVDAILGAYTIAAFDDCGGHVNPHVGYHYHAVTDCLEGDGATSLQAVGPATLEAHGGQIGIAMDGHAIFAHAMADGTTPEGLDACYGHATDGLPYHYHAGEAGSNQILGCLAAEIGCTLVEGETECDATRRPRRP